MAISFSWDDVPKAKDIELKYSDFGDLCELAATEIAEIEKNPELRILFKEEIKSRIRNLDENPDIKEFSVEV